MTTKIELIGFEICPFTQRSHILLLEKKVDFKMTYLPRNKPEWFLKLSPFAQVPTLRVNETALFESLAINEYIDEAFKPQLLAQTVLERAQQRGVSSFSSTLLSDLFAYVGATDAETAQGKLDNFEQHLQQLQQYLGKLNFFNKHKFSFIDASYAPFFVWLQQITTIYNRNLLQSFTKLNEWAIYLLSYPSVKASMVKNYTDLVAAHVKEKFKNSHLNQAT